MTYGALLIQLQEWWNAGLVDILWQGLIVYAILLWIGGVIWTVRDSFLRSESIIFHSTALLLSFLTIPGIILYLLIRPSQTVAERKLQTLEEEILRHEQQQQKNIQGLKKNQNPLQKKIIARHRK